MNTENKYYDETCFDESADERTRFDGSADDKTTYNNGEREATAAGDKGAGGVWQKVTVGGAVGLVLGATVSYLTTARGAPPQDMEETVGDPAPDNHNPLVDNDVRMPSASTVSDDMSFSQAFAAARAEVGAGGAFEWHGGIYSTYTAEEWDNMSSADRDEYNNHFAWNKGDTVSEPKNDMASRTDTHTAPDNTAHTTTDAQPHDQTSQPAADGTGDVAVVTVDAEPDIQVIGMEYFPENNAVRVDMSIDGQDVMLLDYDGDGMIEYVAADLDGSGTIEDEEVGYIGQEGISINDIISTDGDITDPDNDIAGTDEGPDYVNDAFGG